MTCPCKLITQCRLINSDDSLVSQLESIYVQLVSTLVGLVIIQLSRIGIAMVPNNSNCEEVGMCSTRVDVIEHIMYASARCA